MALKIKKFDVVIRLMEDLLGTCPKNREVYSSHIATKDREAMEKLAKKGITMASGGEETKTAEELIEESKSTIKDTEDRGWTSFMRDEDGPFLYDYCV